MIVCKLVRYSGRVQGVGFRYATLHLAKAFPVTGYVRNLGSGDVELVAEGEGADVQAFLDAVANRMAGYIDQQTVLEKPEQGFHDFRIRH
jgi:acylphosphatase